MSDKITINDIDLSSTGSNTKENKPVGTFENIQPAQEPTKSFWDDASEGGDFEDLKPGTYEVTIHSADLKEYANGGRGFEFVTKLETNGQQEWTYFTFEHTNPRAVGMGKRGLKELFVNFGLELPEDLTTMLSSLKSLVGRKATLTIKWTMKNNFKVKDTFGNDVTSSEYQKENVEHNYVKKIFKPA